MGVSGLACCDRCRCCDRGSRRHDLARARCRGPRVCRRHVCLGRSCRGFALAASGSHRIHREDRESGEDAVERERFAHFAIVTEASHGRCETRARAAWQFAPHGRRLRTVNGACRAACVKRRSRFRGSWTRGTRVAHGARGAGEATSPRYENAQKFMSASATPASAGACNV